MRGAMLLRSARRVESAVSRRSYGWPMPLERLGAPDPRILALESPTIAGHTCKTVVAERPPGAGDLAAALAAAVTARAARVPRVRQRLGGRRRRRAAPPAGAAA